MRIHQGEEIHENIQEHYSTENSTWEKSYPAKKRNFQMRSILVFHSKMQKTWKPENEITVYIIQSICFVSASSKIRHHMPYPFRSLSKSGALPDLVEKDLLLLHESIRRQALKDVLHDTTLHASFTIVDKTG